MVLLSSHVFSEDILFDEYVLGLGFWRRWTDDILHFLPHFYECVWSDAERNGSAEHLIQSFSKSVWGLFSGLTAKDFEIIDPAASKWGHRNCPVVLTIQNMKIYIVLHEIICLLQCLINRYVWCPSICTRQKLPQIIHALLYIQSGQIDREMLQVVAPLYNPNVRVYNIKPVHKNRTFPCKIAELHT